MNSAQKKDAEVQADNDLLNATACRLAGDIPGWLPYLYERAHNAVMITGCLTVPKTRGPHKGEPKYLTKERSITVCVTAAEKELTRQMMLKDHE